MSRFERLRNELGWPWACSGHVVSPLPAVVPGIGKLLDAVLDAEKELNQALLDAAGQGLEIYVTVGTGPYRTGPTNETERRWIIVSIEGEILGRVAASA